MRQNRLETLSVLYLPLWVRLMWANYFWKHRLPSDCPTPLARLPLHKISFLDMPSKLQMFLKLVSLHEAHSTMVNTEH
ncbi:hypothetical protein K435DRAFT_153628 [Dendrothele bispora CBS 962.96]|uniref:Uncharacterized protein n=1 Tax=Dendrothele bispora (strain CBS 962.96) TaxID=1314807 RepID=A0A4V6T5D9_DENBC|nr:hypothetical protein K435DRAFT_153628 [Dendrothele bispora CBS 962.96]